MHLEHSALLVDDYDNAIRFFVDILGFDLIEDSPAATDDGRPKRWVVVRPPEAVTGLVLVRADGDDQKAAVGRQWAGRVGLFLRVDDFDAAHRRLVNHGVPIAAGPRTEPYGQVLVFEDLVGNRWDLLGPPADATDDRPARRSANAVERVRVGPSAIHGRGLYAAAPLRPGELVGPLEGVLTDTEGPHVLWVTDELGLEVTNDFRFINHSEDPNCTLTMSEVRTLRAIEEGEELTYDYSGGEA